MPTERVQRRIDKLLDQAEEAADNQEWNGVLVCVDAVLEADSSNADALTFQRMANAALRRDGSDTGDKPIAADSGTHLNTAIDDTPTSFANGRYEVTGFLGEGGKKRVYLVHDTTLDRDVAFGLIKADELDDASRQRITREAQAMARLGDNPNIMPIFDLGEENGQPYMVGPLMGGGDVETLIENAEDGRLSLEDALRISSEICRGLEFAHSKGIIHRDLKPGNVWLTGDGTARIGDFGLALSLDRSRLTQEKVMVGTVSYMPPEQATGGEVTPRADLYSLGAMLYEMVTGRPPFMGDDDIAIIGQHINTPPVAPSWHNQSLPQTLDSLIMRLLSKDPGERPESAEEVLQALEAIDPAETVTHEEEQGSLDSMSGGVFVGRHREMDQLKAAFEETLGGHGKMVALVGEPGIGKTRTAQELGTYASMRGGQVLWGRCYEGGGAPPYWPWIQAIRSYVMDRDAETVRREMGSTASVIAEIVPDVKERLPDVQAPPQIDDPESARFRLFDSITTFLKTASSTQPITLMLEDLHWSDKPSLMLLEFVARELGNSRLMIVGNYRDMELNRRHPLSITLGELSRERLFDRVLLRGLQKHDVRRFIEVAAGIDPPNALVDAVHIQTEGNPLFVTETVRLLIQEGDIASGAKTEGGTSSWDIRIPEGVREVIGRRLDRLSERCNEVLTTAAVMGRQFRFGVLMKLVEDVSENMLLDVLDEALDARIVEEVPSEVGLYQFAHALMQETLTSELSANRTVRLHARIAEALEEFYEDEVGEHAAELVEHFAEAETVLGAERLVHYSLLAGKQSLGTHGHEEAQTHFERGLEAKSGRSEDFETADLLFGLGQAYSFNLGRDELQKAIDTLIRAFDLYMSLGDQDQALSVARFPFPAVHGPKGQKEFVERGLHLAEPGSIDRGHLLARYGWSISTETGDYPGAVRAFEEALEIAKQHHDENLEMEVMASACVVHQWYSEWGAATKCAFRALELASTVDNPLAEIPALLQATVSYLTDGDLAAAEDCAGRSHQVASRIQVSHHLTSAYVGGYMVARTKGDWVAAREMTDRGLAVDPLEWRLLIGAALTESGVGEVESTHGYLDRLISSVGPAIGSPNAGQAIAALGVAYAYLATGDPYRVDYAEATVAPVLDTPVMERFVQFSALAALGAVAVARGDKESASQLCDGIPESQARSGRGWFSLGMIIGLLQTTAGRFEDAERLFADEIEFCRKAGYRPDFASSCGYYAMMLIDRDAPGDRDKAIELQDEAIAIAQELGMTPLLERVLAQREILKA